MNSSSYAGVTDGVELCVDSLQTARALFNTHYSGASLKTALRLTLSWFRGHMDHESTVWSLVVLRVLGQIPDGRLLWWLVLVPERIVIGHISSTTAFPFTLVS